MRLINRLKLSSIGLGGRFALPAGSRGRLSILIFHSVVPEPDPWRFGSICAGDFDRLMAYVSEYFSVLPLEDAVSRLQAGRLPARSLAITFDDGYRDNAEIALPILARHGLTATFFIVTDMLNGGIMWNDSIVEVFRRPTSFKGFEELQVEPSELASESARISACKRVLGQLKYLAPERRAAAVMELVQRTGTTLSRTLMMKPEHVRQLVDSGMTVGGHTATHPILASLADEAAELEIRRGKDELSDLVGQEIKLFAYPNGRPGQDFKRVHVDIVRRLGFTAAVTTSHGTSNNHSDIHQLARFTPWDRDPFRFGLRLLMNSRHAAATV